MSKPSFLPTKPLPPHLIPNDLSPGIGVVLAKAEELLLGEQETDYNVIDKDGKLYFCFGQQFLREPENRKHFIAHEVGHVLFNHASRRGDRDPKVWNLAADAAQHAVGNDTCFEHCAGVTWESLGLPAVMTAELMYDWLMKNASEETKNQPACGSAELSQNLADPETTNSLMAEMLTDVVCADNGYANMLMGTQSGNGRGPQVKIGEMVPPPKWIRESIQYLISSCERNTPRRSWMRENRGNSLLPGRSRIAGYDADIFIDTSGSIPEKDLKLFLSAVYSTPELCNVKVYLFDNQVSGPYLPSNLKGIAPSRGGTLFGPPASLRRDGVPSLWLTDGYPCDDWPIPKQDIWCIISQVKPPYGIHIDASK